MLGAVLVQLEVAASPVVLVPVLVKLEVAAGPGPAEDLGGGPDVVVCTSALDDSRLGISGRAFDDDLDVQPVLGGAPVVRLLP